MLVLRRASDSILIFSHSSQDRSFALYMTTAHSPSLHSHQKGRPGPKAGIACNTADVLGQWLLQADVCPRVSAQRYAPQLSHRLPTAPLNPGTTRIPRPERNRDRRSTGLSGPFQLLGEGKGPLRRVPAGVQSRLAGEAQPPPEYLGGISETLDHTEGLGAPSRRSAEYSPQPLHP